jgi:hypothetical protein
MLTWQVFALRVNASSVFLPAAGIFIVKPRLRTTLSALDSLSVGMFSFTMNSRETLRVTETSTTFIRRQTG